MKWGGGGRLMVGITTPGLAVYYKAVHERGGRGGRGGWMELPCNTATDAGFDGLLQSSIWYVRGSVVDPHHIDTDPDAEPDRLITLMRIRIRIRNRIFIWCVSGSGFLFLCGCGSRLSNDADPCGSGFTTLVGGMVELPRSAPLGLLFSWMTLRSCCSWAEQAACKSNTTDCRQSQGF